MLLLFNHFHSITNCISLCFTSQLFWRLSVCHLSVTSHKKFARTEISAQTSCAFIAMVIVCVKRTRGEFHLISIFSFRLLQFPNVRVECWTCFPDACCQSLFMLLLLLLWQEHLLRCVYCGYCVMLRLLGYL